MSKVIIGKTASGKDIYYNAENKAHTDFTAQDHADAIAAHRIVYNRLATRAAQECELRSPQFKNKVAYNSKQIRIHASKY